MNLPTTLDYPIIAIADLHGQLDQLERLVAKLEKFSEWDDCALVFLGALWAVARTGSQSIGAGRYDAPQAMGPLNVESRGGDQHRLALAA